jgi:hypothetical protein
MPGTGHTATIDDGIEVLTGISAGQKLEDGSYEEGSINALVDQHLFDLAEKLIEFGEGNKKKKEKNE